MKKNIICLGTLLFVVPLMAQQTKQDQVLVNKGKLSIAEGGVMSTLYDFNNSEVGVVENNGSVY